MELLYYVIVIVPILVVLITIPLCVWCLRSSGSGPSISTDKLDMRYAAFLSKASATIAEMKNNPYNRFESTYEPRSGGYIAKVQVNLKSPIKFTADYSFTFTKDEEERQGYGITGSRVDKYGQTIIAKGFMCHSGQAYWKERYIASHDTSIDPDGEGPHLENVECVTMGRFTRFDLTREGRMTFEGEWRSKHKELPSGVLQMQSHVVGSTAAQAEVNSTPPIPAEIVTIQEVSSV